MTGVKVRRLNRKEDDRGWLLKILMRQHLTGNNRFGEIYVTTAYPGVVKGNHYHQWTTEWFCVIKGKGCLVVKNIENKEREEIIMGENNLITVEVPANIAHAVKNVGDDIMYLIAYADREYDPDNPDVIPYNITL